MVLIPLIFNYGINTNAMEIARFALASNRAEAWTKCRFCEAKAAATGEGLLSEGGDGG